MKDFLKFIFGLNMKITLSKGMKIRNMKKLRKVSLTKTKAAAWKAFSLWVRMEAADFDGYARCITCMAKKHYKELQAGHFIPGRNNAVLFSEEGVHPQCYGCNIGKGGNWPSYYEWMKKMYGLEVIDELIRKSHETVKYTAQDYLDIEKLYKEKIKES